MARGRQAAAPVAGQVAGASRAVGIDQHVAFGGCPFFCLFFHPFYHEMTTSRILIHSYSCVHAAMYVQTPRITAIG